MTHTQREISKIFESLEFSAVFVGEENTFFSPSTLHSPLGLFIKRQTNRRQADTVIECRFFCDPGAFERKWRCEEEVIPERFDASFDGE